MSIRIILADDHKMVREALRMLLEIESDLNVVGEAADGQAAVKLSAALQPDVVVMDIAMPGMNGIEATQQLLKTHPEIRVIALSAFGIKTIALEMFEAGARAYIVKSEAAEELVKAVHAVVRGEQYICPIMTEILGEDRLA